MCNNLTQGTDILSPTERGARVSPPKSAAPTSAGGSRLSVDQSSTGGSGSGDCLSPLIVLPAMSHMLCVEMLRCVFSVSSEKQRRARDDERGAVAPELSELWKTITSACEMEGEKTRLLALKKVP